MSTFLIEWAGEEFVRSFSTKAQDEKEAFNLLFEKLKKEGEEPGGLVEGEGFNITITEVTDQHYEKAFGTDNYTLVEKVVSSDLKEEIEKSINSPVIFLFLLPK